MDLGSWVYERPHLNTDRVTSIVSKLLLLAPTSPSRATLFFFDGMTDYSIANELRIRGVVRIVS